MGLTSMNRNREQIAVTHRERKAAPADLHSLENPPPHVLENETLTQRAERFDAIVIARRARLVAADATLTAAQDQHRIEHERRHLEPWEHKTAANRLAEAEKAKKSAVMDVDFAERRATELRAKLSARPDLVAKIEQLVSLAGEAHFRERVRKEVLPRAIAAFDEVIAIDKEVARILEESIAAGSAAGEAIGELGVEYPRRRPQNFDASPARQVIGNAIHAHADAHGIHPNDHGAVLWIAPSRL